MTSPNEAFTPRESIQFPAGSRFGGSHVVSAAYPIAEIEYRERGTVEPETCPRFDELSTQPKSPPIRGLEERQHLTLPCQEQRTYSEDITRYRTCAKKAGALGLNLDRINRLNQKLLPSERHQVQCPFEYQIGIISGPDGAPIPVAISSSNEEPLSRAGSILARISSRIVGLFSGG